VAIAWNSRRSSNQFVESGSAIPTASRKRIAGPRRASKMKTHTYVPVTAGIAQATMIAVDRNPRIHGPSRKRSRPTRVPNATVSTTLTTAKTTVLGSTIRQSRGSENSSW
jgi:hypothetical protein